MKGFMVWLVLMAGSSFAAAVPGFTPGMGRSITINKSQITCHGDMGSFEVPDFSGLKDITLDYTHICEGPYLAQITFSADPGAIYLLGTHESSPWAIDSFFAVGSDGGAVGVPLGVGQKRLIFIDDKIDSKIRRAVEVSFSETADSLHFYLREHILEEKSSTPASTDQNHNYSDFSRSLSTNNESMDSFGNEGGAK